MNKINLEQELEKQIKDSPAFGRVLAGSIEFERNNYNFRNKDYGILRRVLRNMGYYLTLGKYFK